MDEDQLQAYQLALSGHNLLILGQAGTGKTFLTTKIVKSLRHRGKQHRNLVVGEDLYRHSLLSNPIDLSIKYLIVLLR
jgi:signal recognition particle GTPase